MYALRGALAMGVTAVAGGLFVAASAATNRVRASLFAVAITFIVLDWVFVLRVLPDFERYKPVPGFAQTLSARIKPDDALITYAEALPSLVFYLQRHIDPYFLPDEVFDRFRENRGVYAIMSAGELRGARSADQGAHVHHRSAPHLRREAQEHAEPGLAAGAGADHQQVRVLTIAAGSSAAFCQHYWLRAGPHRPLAWGPPPPRA